jgi:hypothetical protein
MSMSQYIYPPEKPQRLEIWVVANTQDMVPLVFYKREIEALRDAVNQRNCVVVRWLDDQTWAEAAAGTS